MAGFAGKIKASWKNMLSMLEELLQEAQMNVAEYSPASRGTTQQVLLNPLIAEFWFVDFSLAPTLLRGSVYPRRSGTPI
ncbi:MAG: hypothetical protein GY862_04630 [Gammaproteobacteria bacterium]|nr:hypothetical protein [Gammaproteobacteria bacterium]